MNIGTIPLGIDNCYLLEGEKCVFIDGGAPNQSRAFVKRMAALGLAPSKIALIILTHAHWDHIGSVHAFLPFIVIPPTHVDIEIGDDSLSLEPYGVPGKVVPIFAEDIGMVKESWRKLLKLGLTTVFPAQGRPFPASVMERKVNANRESLGEAK